MIYRTFIDTYIDTSKIVGISKIYLKQIQLRAFTGYEQESVWQYKGGYELYIQSAGLVSIEKDIGDDIVEAENHTLPIHKLYSEERFMGGGGENYPYEIEKLISSNIVKFPECEIKEIIQNDIDNILKLMQQ